MFNTLLCLQVLLFGDHGAISLTATCHVEVETKPDIESAYSTQMLIVQTKTQTVWKSYNAILNNVRCIASHIIISQYVKIRSSSFTTLVCLILFWPSYLGRMECIH